MTPESPAQPPQRWPMDVTSPMPTQQPGSSGETNDDRPLGQPATYPCCEHKYIVAACPYGCTSAITLAQHEALQPSLKDIAEDYRSVAAACHGYSCIPWMSRDNVKLWWECSAPCCVERQKKVKALEALSSSSQTPPTPLSEELEQNLMMVAKELNGGEFHGTITHVILPIVLRIAHKFEAAQTPPTHELDVTNKQAAISEERGVPTSALRPSNGQEEECWICGAPDHGGECKPMKIYPAEPQTPPSETVAKVECRLLVLYDCDVHGITREPCEHTSQESELDAYDAGETEDVLTNGEGNAYKAGWKAAKNYFVTSPCLSPGETGRLELLIRERDGLQINQDSLIKQCEQKDEVIKRLDAKLATLRSSGNRGLEQDERPRDISASAWIDAHIPLQFQDSTTTELDREQLEQLLTEFAGDQRACMRSSGMGTPPTDALGTCDYGPHPGVGETPHKKTAECVNWKNSAHQAKESK